MGYMKLNTHGSDLKLYEYENYMVALSMFVWESYKIDMCIFF